MTESADSPLRVRPQAPGNATPNAPDSTARPNGRPDSYLNLTEEERLAIATMVTEDDTPVDNWFSEKQRRLLVDPLYASWQGPGEGRPFVAASDVGVFRSPLEPPLVPDAFVSLDVLHPQDWWEKPNRVYAIWQYMKPPDIVIEVVSNREGGETGEKMDRYASFGVPCYVVFDPARPSAVGGAARLCARRRRPLSPMPARPPTGRRPGPETVARRLRR